MDGKQLELQLELEAEFEKALELAATYPEIPLISLWHKLDDLMQIPDLSERLRQAGRAIAQIVEVFALRVDQRLEAWESKYSPPPELFDPILNDEFFQPFLRQSQTLHLEDLLEEYHRDGGSREASDPIVGEVDKQAVLDFVEQVESEAEALEHALSLAHDEDYAAWCAILLNTLHSERSYSLTDLNTTSDLSLIQIWITLLLNPTTFILSQQWSTPEEFYDYHRITITLASRVDP